MSVFARLVPLLHAARAYRPLLQLALLAIGLLAVAMAGGAPECLPEGPC
jgi:hypothetical protein